MRRLLMYNVVAVVVLFCSMELTTRCISWISGNGFFLSLHEIDPSHEKIKKIYKWHPFVGFTFNPNSEFEGSHPFQKHKSTIFIDRNGFLAKDNDLRIEKESNEVRIAMIGGSTTANTNLSYDQNWPGYLGNLIQSEFPDLKIRVINAGVPGFDTAQSVVNLALRVMPYDPDIVVIYHAYNDLKAIRLDLEFEPDYSHIHETPYGFAKPPNCLASIFEISMLYTRVRNSFREYKMQKRTDSKTAGAPNRLAKIPAEAERTFEEHVRIMIATAKSGGASVVLSSFATLHDPDMNWESTKDTINRLSEFQRINIPFLLHFTPGLTLPGIFDGIKRFNHVLRKIAVQEGVCWVYNANLVPHEDQYFVDRVHFSATGAKSMAENLALCVKNIVANKKTSERQDVLAR